MKVSWPQVGSITDSKLAGLCYEPVTGTMAGCWGKQFNGGQYFQDLTWDVPQFRNTDECCRWNGAFSRYCISGRALIGTTILKPIWRPLRNGLRAYAVAKNGQVIAANGGGFARDPTKIRIPACPLPRTHG